MFLHLYWFRCVLLAQVYECLTYCDHLAEVDYLVARQMAETGA